MTEHPILFSGAMVRAILDGRKTQTRRVVRDQPDRAGHAITWWQDEHGWFEVDEHTKTRGGDRRCPYGQPGDVLWCRETWWQGQGPTWEDHCVVYDCDKAFAWMPGSGFDDFDLRRFRKRPSIHMPRWACRLFLDVVSVRVERLQAISEVDAFAEGIDPDGDDYQRAERFAAGGSPVQGGCPAVFAYVGLWDSINGDRPGCSWADNPWVFVVEFRRVP